MSDVSRAVTEGYKIWLAGGGLLLVIAWPWLRAHWRKNLLVALTLLSVANYFRWGTQTAFEKVDVYDLIHYYLNARYFDELGYLDLYPAVILADAENDGPFFDQGNRYMAQIEGTNEHAIKPIEHALARGRVVRETRFTPERWEAFEHDVLYLQREIKPLLPDKVWREMIQDHGYNGTPFWTLLAEPLARVVPVESVKLLGYLDVVLIGAAVASVAWAYGGLTPLWLLFFLSLTYSLRWPQVTWVFLRYDYVCALIIATSLLKRGRHGLAGGVAGYAALVRFFPAMWMWGPFMKGLSGLLRPGPLALGARLKAQKSLLVMAAAFLVVAAVGQGLATARYGTGTVGSHFVNMLDHNTPEQLSSRRIGLALGLAYDGSTMPKFISKERKQEIADQKPVRYGLALFVLLGMGWAFRNARDDEAFGFGFLPFFLLTTASYYYYVCRATLVVVHAGDLDNPRNRVGLAMLFGIEMFCNWAETYHPGHRVFLIGWLAWGLMAYTSVMMLLMLHEARQRDALAPEVSQPARPSERRAAS